MKNFLCTLCVGVFAAYGAANYPDIAAVESRIGIDFMNNLGSSVQLVLVDNMTSFTVRLLAKGTAIMIE